MDDLVSSLTACAATLVLLSIYSTFDFRERKVPNRLMLAGGITGAAVNVLSGHFHENLYLHLFALAFTLSISYILFKLGAFGGADAKSVITVAIISPGFEFTMWENPLVEAILAVGLEVLVMLLLGHLCWHRENKYDKETVPPPLIPLLLVGYILVTGFSMALVSI